jgi:asparagine synthase (glutamine-hydrolysing)
VCGIAGIARPGGGQGVDEEALLRMARAIRHRGPDGFGLARLPGAGFVSTRLAIVDLANAWQPMQTRPGGETLVYNGEVYNHVELRAELERDGAGLATTSDTEVVMRLLEREGPAALPKLNGQWALAWWEPEARRLTLVRDRFGVRPLHYALLPDGSLVFGSEAKALFASGEVHAAPDVAGIDEVFTLWATSAPRTAFRGVRQVPPGQLVVWERGRIVAERPWWTPDYDGDGGPAGALEPLMRDSVRLRLRADVPVGTYLSGGLDSSVITALARDASDHQLRTFSVAFHDPLYDERPHQRQVARALATRHHLVDIGPEDIAAVFRDVVWHAESPLIRTSPAPLYLLARAAREHGITVVATGEGADELFWGYDLFKEVLLRASPDGADGLDALYPHLTASTARRGPAWRRFFLEAGPADDPLFSHQTRIAATSAVKAFYRDDVAAELGDPLERLRAELPERFAAWSPLERAAYLEVRTLLAGHLLAAQGDRVAMAHGVEGRYPFLDDRVFAHSVRLPEERKLGAGGDKIELRELGARLLPRAIATRGKQPYRAPEVAPFFGPRAPEWVADCLSDGALRATGIFDERRVSGLLRRCRAGRATGLREGMALVGVLSTQVWHQSFCSNGAAVRFPAETGRPRVYLDQGMEAHR